MLKNFTHMLKIVVLNPVPVCPSLFKMCWSIIWTCLVFFRHVQTCKTLPIDYLMISMLSNQTCFIPCLMCIRELDTKMCIVSTYTSFLMNEPLYSKHLTVSTTGQTCCIPCLKLVHSDQCFQVSKFFTKSIIIHAHIIIAWCWGLQLYGKCWSWNLKTVLQPHL